MAMSITVKDAAPILGVSIDTLYRWRASGKQISQLQPGQLARFRVRIYLR